MLDGDPMFRLHSSRVLSSAHSRSCKFHAAGSWTFMVVQCRLFRPQSSTLLEINELHRDPWVGRRIGPVILIQQWVSGTGDVW